MISGVTNASLPTATTATTTAEPHAIAGTACRRPLDEFLRPLELHELPDEFPIPLEEAKRLFVRFRSGFRKRMDVSVSSLTYSWNAFVRRSLVEDIYAVIEAREAERRQYSLTGLRDEVHRICWEEDRSYQATYQTIVQSRQTYEAHPESEQATPRGDVEHSEVAKELSDLRERVRILSAETDTAQGDVRDNEENLESLSKTVFDLRGQLESLKQSHAALKEQNR
ncbi:hypothetical protein BBJ28_00027044, partial [Nothophytophthora sp. Chile5]